MLFAQRVFHIAGIYGLAVLLPQFFIELLPAEFVKQQLGEEIVPGAVHPEHFYGFVGVAACKACLRGLLGCLPVAHPDQLGRRPAHRRRSARLAARSRSGGGWRIRP